LAEDATRITGSARHLLGLIDQILNLSSIDAGHEGMAARDVDVRHLIEESVSAVQEDARANGNRISVRVSPEAERAYTDGNKLAVCVSAVLSNAVKFTSNGLIAVTAECTDVDGREMLSISVSDTGVGIAPQDLQRAFMPFVQLDSTATREKGGMGLGLAIAQRMAKAIGGDVSAISERGAGSTFTIRTLLRLPRHEAQRAAA
jgi:signal transduction histidine kinase